MFESKNIENILLQYREKKLAHAFLLETNNQKKCYQELLRIIKIINCPFEYEDKCKKDCNICHLINKNNLPSLEVIEPIGTNIKKNQVLEMMQKFSTKPIITKYNIYIINNAEYLNTSSGNTILKFLEEPTENIIGFFITNNKENVLTTIKSRCQTINCIYNLERENIIIDYLEDVKTYLDKIYLNKENLLYNKITMTSKYNERKQWLDFFQTMFYYLKECLEENRDDKIEVLKKISNQNIINIIILIENVLKYIKSNGNIDLILDKFVLEMRNYYD